jgi:hypothetical protein
MGTRLAGMSAPRKTRERGAGGYPCATLYLYFRLCRFGIVNTCFGPVNTHFGKPQKAFTFNRNSRSPSTEIGVHVQPKCKRPFDSAIDGGAGFAA